MDTGLTSRYDARPALDVDLDDVVRLIEAADRALDVPSEPIRDELIWTWHLPTTDLARDTRVVRDDAVVVAYAEAIWKHPADGGPLRLMARVHPDYRDTGIESWLFDWGEGLAQGRGSEGIRTYAADRDAPAHDLMRARGYVHVRSVFTMRKELGPDEHPGSPPDGVTIRGYDDADERTLFETHEASFAEHWGFRPKSFESFNEELHAEDWDPSLVFLATAGEATVGYVVPFLFETCGYVAILGVVKKWRGRGIAKALLGRSFVELVGRGTSEVRPSVDTQNASGALALYEGMGMSVYNRYDTFDLGTTEVATGRTPP